MNLPRSTSRRRFLQAGALASAAGLLAPPGRGGHPAPPPPPLKLGVASYSMRQLSRADAFALTRDLGTANINIKSFHLPYDTDALDIAVFSRELEEAGLTITGGGVVPLKQDTDTSIREAFVYARAARMPLMVIAPTPATLPRIERAVQEFDLPVAIHNHGPEDPLFPTGASILPHIERLDPRVGVCLDIGHSARAGSDLVAEAALLGPRLLDLHIKDLTDLHDRTSICTVGDGVLPIAAFMRQLVTMNYAGYANLEYEIDAENPGPGMHRSFAFMRGVAAGLSV